MPWLLPSLSQQRSWPCRFSRSLSSTGKDFNYPCHLIVQYIQHRFYHITLCCSPHNILSYTQTGSILICCFSFLHQVVLEQVCRIARIISSPHEVAHLVLVAEGCPGRCTLMANLAANLCGFTVAHINPSPMSSAMQYKMDVFKADLVAAYTRAGVKVRVDILWPVNTLRPRQNGHRFADDTFKRIFLNENVRISIRISLKFVPKGPINNNPALVQIMAWRWSGNKPLSEPMMVSLLTHICVARPQWVKTLRPMSVEFGVIIVQI